MRFFTNLFIIYFFIISIKSNYAQEPDKLNLQTVIEKTLLLNPNIKISKEQVKNSLGMLQLNRGLFDANVLMELDYNSDYSPEFFNNVLISPAIKTTSYQLGISKLLKFGASLNLSLLMIRTQDTLQYAVPPNIATIQFQFNLPILKGLGEDATLAQVTASELTKLASEKDLLQSISTQVYTSVQAYWNYVASKKSYDEFNKSIVEAEKFIEENKTLAEYNNIPGSNITPLLASLSTKNLQLSSAEQSIYSSKHALGIAMGISNEEIENLPLPDEDFPEDPDSVFIESINLNSLINISLNNRSDYLAAKYRELSAKILFEQAKNNTLSQLDLSLSLGISGISEGTQVEHLFDPYFKNLSGPNVGATLTYNLDFKNNSAKGGLLSASSQFLQSQIAKKEIERNIVSDVSVGLEQLKKSFRDLTQAKNAVKYYRQSLNEEEQKLKLGFSNLISINYLEGSLTDAITQRINVQQNLENAIAKMNYLTGLLVSSNGSVNYININSLKGLTK